MLRALLQRRAPLLGNASRACPAPLRSAQQSRPKASAAGEDKGEQGVTDAGSGPSTGDDGQSSFPVWKSAAFALLCGAGVFAYMRIESAKQEAKKKLASAGVAGAVRLGGPIAGLVDHHGRPFDSTKLANTFMLVYFGFTHCPDVCPEELDKISAVMRILQEKSESLSKRVLPLFITVDSKRDTVEIIRDYLKDFHESILGLTGAAEDIGAIAKKYRVYFKKARTTAKTAGGGQEEGRGAKAAEQGGAAKAEAQDGGTAKGSTEEGDYLIDHSIFVFLVDPKGKYVTHFGRESVPARTAATIIDAIEEWEDADDGDDLK